MNEEVLKQKAEEVAIHGEPDVHLHGDLAVAFSEFARLAGEAKSKQEDAQRASADYLASVKRLSELVTQ